MRTLFIGSTKRGYLTLKALVDHRVEVAGIISLEQDPHELGRYEEPIRALANTQGIPLLETKWMKDRDYGSIIRNDWKPDIALVVGCRILLSRDVYEAPPRGTLAVHDSYLPEYRGFAPLNWAIISGDDHTGVTLFYLSEQTDGGDIVARKRIPFGTDETAPEIYERIIDGTIELVVETWPLLAEGKAERLAQDYRSGSMTCSRTPADGCIDWEQPTRRIYDLVRALARPYPGAYTFFGGQKLIVWKARPAPDAAPYVGRIPGRVVSVSPSEGFVDVLTGDGVLRIAEVQTEGGESLPASQVIKSVKTSLGVTVATLWDELQKLRKR